MSVLQPREDGFYRLFEDAAANVLCAGSVPSDMVVAWILTGPITAFLAAGLTALMLAMGL